MKLWVLVDTFTLFIIIKSVAWFRIKALTRDNRVNNINIKLNQLLLKVAAIGTIAALTACASNNAVQQDLEPNKLEAVADVEAEVDYKPFELQTLYSLLVADIAAQRGRYDVTMRNYLRQAVKTNDAGIARHSTMLAEMLRAETVALKSAEVWTKAAPNSAQALKSTAIHQGRARQLDKAFDSMSGALALQGDTDFAALAALSNNIPRARKEAILERYNQLIANNPDNIDLLMGQSTLQQSLGMFDESLASTSRVLDLQADNVSALTNQASLLQQLNRSDEAFAKLEQALAKSPDDKRLRLQYARLLTKSDMTKAQEQFEILGQQHPDDYELQFTLALVYRENQQVEKAKVKLATLLEVDSDNPSVHYYLGLIAEDEGNSTLAIEHYQQVGPSRVFIAAQARYVDIQGRNGNPDDIDDVVTYLTKLAEKHSEHATDLTLLASDALTRSGQLEKSYALLSDALVEQPDNQNLLYTRSMLNEKRLDLDGMEDDLRQVIKLDPDNATALNALGYTLTVHTERFDEAFELIQRALNLQPDDPAIMDSMGWIEYRRGNLDQAISYLEKAYTLFPDPEVAAHLGEALWAAGKKAEAKQVWRTALKTQPDSAILQKIIDRFGQP